MEVFNQTLHDMGYDLGWDYMEALEAMKPIADLYREYHQRYEFCEMKMAGAVDYRVFTQGIPGGQISIMRNELVRNGYGHLFDKVIDQIQRVRTQVGGVALVTPTSEHVARQSIVNAMNGQDETNDHAPLWPGYSEMLRGVMGRPPSAPDANLQKRALREYTLGIFKTELAHITDEETLRVLRDPHNISALVEFMWEYSAHVRNLRDGEALQHRIDQLTQVDATKYAAQIKESQDQLALLKGHMANQQEDDSYTALLKCQPDTASYKKLVAGAGKIGELVSANKISKEDFCRIIKASTMCTVCPSTILEPAMERSRCEIEQIAVDKEFGIHDDAELPQRGTQEFEEYAILQCMFKHAQNIAQFWFQHNQHNPQFWDKNFPMDFPFDRVEKATEAQTAKAANPVCYPYRTKVNGNGDKVATTPQVIEWSETELRRIVAADVAKLNFLQNKLKQIEAYREENDNRKILKQRSLQKVQKAIDECEKLLNSKIKASIYNTQAHQAGYQVDVDTSIKQNVKKAMSLH